VHRAMRGLIGPADVFRNPEAIFCLFEKPPASDLSPFDLVLCASGREFAVVEMHFKLGLYEHQSAGAIQGLLDILARHPRVLDEESKIRGLRISIYQPAYGIICDPAKRDPRSRQSADHSMLYIVATLLRKALAVRSARWEDLMLMPSDYDGASLLNGQTRQWMRRIELRHGGAQYDERYPDGIPTTVELDHEELGQLSSGLVMYPEGHARNTSGNLDRLLSHKFRLLAGLGVSDTEALHRRFTRLWERSPREIASLYDFEIRGVP